MAEKTPNHASSEMKCPVSLGDVDLFGVGGQEHWYEAYELLHEGAPVLRIPDEGLAPGSDGYVLTKYSDISRVVKDADRFKPTITIAVDVIAARFEEARKQGQAASFSFAFSQLHTLYVPGVIDASTPTLNSQLTRITVTSVSPSHTKANARG